MTLAIIAGASVFICGALYHICQALDGIRKELEKRS